MAKKTLAEQIESFNKKQNFNNAKDLYERFRQEQKYEIIDRLSDLGIEVITEKDEKSGQGKSYYGYKRFKKYDNRNWKWVDIIIDNKVAFCISLQAFDIDKSSGNYHVLFDRIGIYQYHNDVLNKYLETKRCSDLKTINAVEEMKVTDIDLPMDKDKFEELIDFLYQCVLNNIQCYERSKEVLKKLKPSENED